MVPDLEPLAPHKPFDLELECLALKSQMAESGHQLFRTGTGLFCRLCRRRSGRGWQFWCRNPCAEHAAVPPDLRPQVHAPLVPQTSQSRVADALDLPPVTTQTRRRAVREQHLELRKRKRLDQAVTSQAARVMEVGTSSAWVDTSNFTTVLPPIALGRGHTLIACGGYVGCVKCCGVSGYTRDSNLTAACSGGCPAGSRRPLKRLARGLLPRPLSSGSGHIWPSGETHPLVSLILAPAAGGENLEVG